MVMTIAMPLLLLTNEPPSPEVIAAADTQAPTIYLVGDTEVTLERNSVYFDVGATALDNLDGDITDQITTTNNLDTTVIGDYYVSFSVTDSSNNIATAIRRTIHIITPTDTVLPTVVSIDPSDGATAIPSNKTIVVTFSEQIAPISAIPQNIILSFDHKVVKASIRVEGNVIKITPIDLFLENSEYHLLISDITDMVGNQMIESFTSSFKTI